MNPNYTPPSHPMIHVSSYSGCIVINPNEGDRVVLTASDARDLGLRLMEIALHQLDIEKRDRKIAAKQA